MRSLFIGPLSRRRLLVFVAVALAASIVAAVMLQRDSGVAGDSPPAHRSHNPETPGAPVAVDSRRQQLGGIRTAPVSRGRLGGGFRAPGRITNDETRLFDVNLKLDGWIGELHVNYTGQFVRKNDPLFTIYSPDLLAAQVQYLTALTNRDQLSPAQQADPNYGARLLDTPRQRLLRWDVPEDQIRALEKGRTPLEAVIFRSPVSGVVIQKNVVKGAHVREGDSLYRLADFSVVWVEAAFSESDIADIRIGSTARIAVEGLPGRQFSGRVFHVAPSLTTQTRSVTVRIDVSNRDGHLRPGMLADVEIDGHDEEGLIVPADAVIDSGRRQVVFVAAGEGYFEPRTVVVGRRSGGRQLVLSGVQEGEAVVARAAFLIDSESQLGAALRDYERADAGAGAATKESPVSLTFSPPAGGLRAGENVVVVTALDNGRPVTDAEVTVQFSMAAMASMNMPAMQSVARLEHVDGGRYQGVAKLQMAGAWLATVTAMRGGRALSSRQVSVVAR